MSTMISEVYDALKSAGADDDKSIAEIKASQMLVKWMVGFNLAFTLAIVWRVFT